jgi:broad specificity phosphatase PhoE
MLRVYLLRHGETAYNADGNRYCGRTDIKLTDKGIRQAESVYQRLKSEHIDAVYSSPLYRAKRTAEIATQRQVKTDERIIEVDFGNWEGKTKEEFIAENAALWENWMNDPENNRAGGNGETGGEVVDRLTNFYNELLVRHAGQTIVVVGHNGVNRLYMARQLGMNLKYYRRIVQENSAITLFELDDNGEFTLKKLNA